MERSTYYESNIPAAAGGILEKVVRPVARITIDLNRPVGTISPHIYGHFTEHIGGVIYDGIWVGEDSPIPNIGGIRSSLVEHLRRIRPPVIRLPGARIREARQTVLSHTDIHAHNTSQQPAEVTPRTSEVVLRGDTSVFTFPPASVVRLDNTVNYMF
jgi:alpha-L-arabinofuranosidase